MLNNKQHKFSKGDVIKHRDTNIKYKVLDVEWMVDVHNEGWVYKIRCITYNHIHQQKLFQIIRTYGGWCDYFDDYCYSVRANRNKRLDILIE